MKVASPRTEKVEVDGWTMPPFMGLTSWAAFTPGEKLGVEAMVMGDLVLFEDEVSDAMSAALGAGLAVTALHNQFFFDKPRVMFMHIEGEGAVDVLGKAVRAALDAAKAARGRSAQPQDRFGGPPIPAASSIDAAKIEAVFGVKPQVKEGMAKVVIGRAAGGALCLPPPASWGTVTDMSSRRKRFRLKRRAFSAVRVLARCRGLEALLRDAQAPDRRGPQPRPARHDLPVPAAPGLLPRVRPLGRGGAALVRRLGEAHRRRDHGRGARPRSPSP